MTNIKKTHNNYKDHSTKYKYFKMFFISFLNDDLSNSHGLRIVLMDMRYREFPLSYLHCGELVFYSLGHFCFDHWSLQARVRYHKFCHERFHHNFFGRLYRVASVCYTWVFPQLPSQKTWQKLFLWAKSLSPSKVSQESFSGC